MKRNPPAARLHIDWTRCDGRGICTELMPGVLTRDEWGYPRAVDGSREPAIPAGIAPAARAAVGRCPKLALTLLHGDPGPKRAPNPAIRPSGVGG